MSEIYLWQQPDFPHFYHNPSVVKTLEEEFTRRIVGTFRGQGNKLLRPDSRSIPPVSGFAAHVSDSEYLDLVTTYAEDQRVTELSDLYLAKIFFKASENERLTACPINRQAYSELEEFTLLRVIILDVSTSLKKLIPCFGMKTEVEHRG